MSYKRNFWEWIKANKKMPADEEKKLKSLYKKEHAQCGLYNISTLQGIDAINSDGRLDLYREFFIAFSGKGSELQQDEKEIAASDEDHKSHIDGESTDIKAASLNGDNGEFAALSQTDRPHPADLYTFLSKQQADIKGRIAFEEEKTKEYQPKQEDNIVYDIATNIFCDLNQKLKMPMATFVEYPSEGDRKELFLRNEKSFSYPFNPYNTLTPAHDLKKERTPYGIVEKSINTIIEEHNLSSLVKSICLIPDTLSDFKDDIKKQLGHIKGKVVPIPRSIAAAYAFALKTNKECDLTVYDLDLDGPCETTIGIVKNKQGEFEFIRKRRRIRDEMNNCSLSVVLKKYLNEYALKHRIDIPQNTCNILVDSRDILSPIWGMGNILIQTKNTYETLGFDLHTLQTALMPAFALIGKEKDTCFLINIGINSEEFLSLDGLCDGCREIIKRIENGKTIWREYLPELSLEVIKNGRFERLWLIKKDKLPIDISENSMQEQVDIRIDGGTFFIPAGVEEVLLPLEREEFGNSKRDKMAKFSGNVLPSSHKTEVRLKLSYSFGDPDSYKLTAVGVKEKAFVVSSIWCNSDEEKIKSEDISWPVYNKNDQIGLDITEWAAVKGQFKGIEERLDNVIYFNFRLDEIDRNGFVESNFFQNLRPTRYKPNLIRKATEIDNYGKEYKRELDSFFSSDTFSALANYLISPETTELYKKVKYFASLKRNLDTSILTFMSILGVFYRIKSPAEKVEIKDALLERFDQERREHNRMEYLINASRCISDQKDIMNTIAVHIGENINPQILRNISVVCWYNEKWIYNLYKASPKAISEIENCCANYIIDTAKNEIAKKPLKVRDIMETALALCRLREYDKTIFNPNEERTKQIVNAVKHLDKIVYEYDLENSSFDKPPFVSRIEFDETEKERDGLEAMCDVCYLLLTQLIGNKRLNLMGFKED